MELDIAMQNPCTAEHLIKYKGNDAVFFFFDIKLKLSELAWEGPFFLSDR